MQVLPSPVLAGIVRHFLMIAHDHTANVKHRMFSDGNTGMVFNFGNLLLHEELGSGHLSALPGSFLYGQLDAFQNIFSQGKMGMLIAVFHPYGASALLKVPAASLRNSIVDLECFYPNETAAVRDHIFHTPDTLQKIRVVENFLMAKLHAKSAGDKRAGQAIQLIQQHYGSLSVLQVSSILNVSERQLQRTFQEHVGLSPKRYSGVIRVQHFLKLLRHNPAPSLLTELGYDSGFYDQAHLIREFKNLSGITPGQYVNQTNLLAANLLQIAE